MWQIQEESGAKVRFSDRNSNPNSDEDRTVLIRGDTEAAQKAELMIRQIIADMPATVTEEIEVPGYSIGRIIGMHLVFFFGYVIGMCLCLLSQLCHWYVYMSSLSAVSCSSALSSVSSPVAVSCVCVCVFFFGCVFSFCRCLLPWLFH